MATRQAGIKTIVGSRGNVKTLLGNLTLVAFILIVFMGGGTSVAMRFTYAEMPPFWSGTARFMVGALMFWGITLLWKIEIPKGRALLGAMLFGALSFGGTFILGSWGLVKTPASLFQILMALVPLLTLLFAYFHGLENLTWRKLFGSFLAVIGIGIVMGGSSGTGLSPLRVLAIIGAAGLMAEGGIVAKRFPRTHPIATNAIAMTVGSIMLGGASLLTGEQWVIPAQLATWMAFGYLILLVNLIPLLYLFILRQWTASRTSYYFVLIPLVTVIVASTLASEHITWYFLLGGALVLSGVIIGAMLPSKPCLETVEGQSRISGELALQPSPCS